MTHTDRRGPGVARPKHQKKLHHPPTRPVTSTSTTGTNNGSRPSPIESLILLSISSALSDTLANSALPTIIQNIKHLLYEKQFLKVFEDQTVLDAYATRWVPSRALAFREIMGDSEYIERLLSGRKAGSGSRSGVATSKGKEREEVIDEEEMRSKIICLGGGAGSELISFVALLSPENAWLEFPKPEVKKDGEGSDEEEDDVVKPETPKGFPPCDIHLLDIGPYSPVVDKFTASLRTTLPSTSFTETFHQTDILSPESTSLETILRSPPTDSSSSTPPPLITLFYTLSELFLQSRPATIIFLDKLSRQTPKGTLFLIVDSANEEASALGVGKAGRSYSLADVLDGLLCVAKTNDGDADGVPPKARWKKLEGVDSRWFRLKAGLQDEYPVKLENSRYWSRLYRRE